MSVSLTCQQGRLPTPQSPAAHGIPSWRVVRQAREKVRLCVVSWASNRLVGHERLPTHRAPETLRHSEPQQAHGRSTVNLWHATRTPCTSEGPPTMIAHVGPPECTTLSRRGRLGRGPGRGLYPRHCRPRLSRSPCRERPGMRGRAHQHKNGPLAQGQLAIPFSLPGCLHIHSAPSLPLPHSYAQAHRALRAQDTLDTPNSPHLARHPACKAMSRTLPSPPHTARPGPDLPPLQGAAPLPPPWSLPKTPRHALAACTGRAGPIRLHRRLSQT